MASASGGVASLTPGYRLRPFQGLRTHFIPQGYQLVAGGNRSATTFGFDLSDFIPQGYQLVAGGKRSATTFGFDLSDFIPKGYQLVAGGKRSATTGKQFLPADASRRDASNDLAGTSLRQKLWIKLNARLLQ